MIHTQNARQETSWGKGYAFLLSLTMEVLG